MGEVLAPVAVTGGTAQYAWLLVVLPAFGAFVLLAGGRPLIQARSSGRLIPFWACTQKVRLTAGNETGSEAA